MSFYLDGSGTNYITLSAGGCGAMGTGAFTIVAMWKTDGAGGSFFNRAAFGLYASSTLTRALEVDSSAVYGTNDFSSGYGSTTTGIWYVGAITKPAGSAHYRFHLWTYASDGSGTMSHGESAGAANQGDGSAITAIRIGSADFQGNGWVAVLGLWTSELADAQLDTLKSASLSSWSALSPQALITGNNWNGSTGANDVVGTSTQQSITGTVTTGAEPSGFSYSLTAGIKVPWVKF
jgi:hypothetical protein